MILIIIMISACTTRQQVPESLSDNTVKYATGFHFETSEASDYLVVDLPWPNAQKGIRYDLRELPKTFVCTSTTHLPFFEMLESEASVIGFPNLKYIS